MRAYVAAPYSEYRMAREVMALLRAGGVAITHDWTLGAEDLGKESDLPSWERREAAREDLDGVGRADFVVLLTVQDKSLGCGMWVEMGYALACRNVVVLVGPQRARTVFCELADVSVETAAEAVAYVLSEARES